MIPARMFASIFTYVSIRIMQVRFAYTFHTLCNVCIGNMYVRMYGVSLHMYAYV